MNQENVGSSKRSLGLILLSCAVLTLLKLWLIAEDEVYARYAPHDQSWYIKAAHHLIHGDWLGPYDAFALIRQPGYPLWIAMVHWIGISLRTATELFFLGSALLFTVSLSKNRLPVWLCGLIFFCIAFHPLSLYLHNEALSENLYAALLLLSLGGMLLAWATRRPGRLTLLAWLIGACLAFLWNTRHENMFVMIYFSVFVFLDAFFTWKKRDQRREIKLRLAILSVIPLICIVSLTFTFRSLNHGYYGQSLTSEMFAEGFVETCRALLSIKHPHPRRLVPVPQEVRRLAYEASPTFKRLEGRLENNKSWISHGCTHDRVCDDFSGGWFHFALRHAAFDQNLFSSSSEMNAFFQTVADELKSACGSARLPCRTVYFRNSLTYISPEISSYLSHLIPSVPQVLRLFATSPPLSVGNLEGEVPLTTRKLFEEVAGKASNSFNSLTTTRSLLKNFIFRYYPALVWMIGILAAIAFCVLIFRIRSLRGNFIEFGVILLLFSIIGPRILLLILLNASSLKIDDFRLIYPIAGLSMALMLALIYQAAGRLKA